MLFWETDFIIFFNKSFYVHCCSYQDCSPNVQPYDAVEAHLLYFLEITVILSLSSTPLPITSVSFSAAEGKNLPSFPQAFFLYLCRLFSILLAIIVVFKGILSKISFSLSWEYQKLNRVETSFLYLYLRVCFSKRHIYQNFYKCHYYLK